MDVPTAAFWLDAITAGAAAAWLAGAWFVASTKRRCREPIRGERRVDMPAADVMRALAHQFATGGGEALRPSIDSATDREVRWHSGRPLSHEGRITVSPGAGSTRVEWELTRGYGQLLVGTIVVALGALVVVGLHVALRLYAVPSPNYFERVQVLQMVQAVHVLWPPFLFAGLARLQRRQLAQEMERMVGNAPFAARTAAPRS
ncbi:MAG TPA: hypothetical protein VF384_17825 [Planctomycetota bacterium]